MLARYEELWTEVTCWAAGDDGTGKTMPEASRATPDAVCGSLVRKGSAMPNIATMGSGSQIPSSSWRTVMYGVHLSATVKGNKLILDCLPRDRQPKGVVCLHALV